MASLIDIAGLNLATAEANQIAKAIIEKHFDNGELAETHSIELGVLHKQQIVFIGKMANQLTKAVGCVPNGGTGISMTEKTWDPEIFATRWEHCAADLNKLFKLFKQAAKINPDFYNRIGSEEMGVIFALIEKMLKDNLKTIVWFSERNADLAPAGSFSPNTNLALFNTIDGLFQQIFAEIGTTASNYVEIAENAGANYASQALQPDAALKYLTAIVNAADSRLLSDTTAQILVTRSIADNYRNTLRDKTLGAGFVELTENGVPALVFDGRRLKVRYDWDATIKADQNDGTRLNKPHRIVYTTPENIPVATLSVDDLNTLESFYDQYRKTNVIDVAFSLDTKHLEKYMTVAAY